jgi:hypothetical protein
MAAAPARSALVAAALMVLHMPDCQCAPVPHLQQQHAAARGPTGKCAKDCPAWPSALHLEGDIFITTTASNHDANATVTGGEKQIDRGSTVGHLNPLGLCLRTSIDTTYMAYSECLPTRLNQSCLNPLEPT